MSDIPGKPAGAAAVADDPHRVMVVDDSAVIRGLLSRALEGDPELRVVASVGDGQMAINALTRQSIDVIVLDIEMPVMDGLTAIPKLVAIDPAVKIIMASTLTLRGAEVSMKALQSGAADYVTKPSSTRELGAADSFKRELVSKVKALAASARRAGSRNRPSLRNERVAAPLAPLPRPRSMDPAAVVLRPMPAVVTPPDIIAIGSSTGGPQALFEVLSHLKGGIRQPILITQHMPATFTTILAEHITRQCGIACAEAKDGEPLVGGRIYLAPGDFHMTLATRGGGTVLSVNKDPPENFCRPAVDPMMRTIAKIYGRRAFAIILTGMGQDGMRGCAELVAAGGIVIAQDEPSSVVWGMPGAVSTAGLCSAVLPLREIGPYIRKIVLRTAA
ncbi:chemotaxis response regulator protein-glutamate methylesterase [Skermanella rosea]|uniref:protein-glutamate methylesterase/protein-glutamine glutaminase n=1 Tax=Skermanella rosea TaxID=1817965 RepID=UPI001E3B1A2D|nr:chemotaxis response regulator protein-glutamate methylesterase [Skermanella rosea]UEM04226.1 chemotaxis response regulator protein-glutamate methylesterase [Skermanella rosea]